MKTKILTNKVYKPYLAAIKKEISIESSNISQMPDYSGCLDIHPILNNYINSDIGISSEIESDWFKILPGLIGKRFNGLSLGSGTGRHQILLANLGIVEKWNSIDLVINRGELFNFNNKEKIFEVENDLNFINLPENTYDIIFCHGLLHHILNIESLLIQVNKSLTKNGVFIIEEYIGEDQWQWEKEKLELINDFLGSNFKNLYQNNKVEKYNWNVLRASRPLEAIRSSEIPTIINSVFKENILEYKSQPVIYTIINSMSSEIKNHLLLDKTLLSDFLYKIVEFDKKVRIENTNILSCLQIGIYKKNNDVLDIQVKPWGKNKLRKKLLADFSYRFPRNLYNKIKSFKIQILNEL